MAFQRRSSVEPRTGSAYCGDKNVCENLFVVKLMKRWESKQHKNTWALWMTALLFC